MFKFEGTKKRKDFKTENGYLNYIYRQNKEKIDEVFGKNARSKFKNNIRDNKVKYGTNIRGALKVVASSNSFTPVNERLYDNLYKGLKSDNELFKTFRNLTKDAKGRYTKYDTNLLKWDRFERMYVYNGIIGVSFENSPQMTVLTDLRTNRIYQF